MYRLKEFVAKEQEVTNSLEKNLKKEFPKNEGYEIVKELRWGNTSSRKRFDLSIMKNGQIFAILELKIRQRIGYIDLNLRNFVFDNTSADYFIYYYIEDENYIIWRRDYINEDPIEVKNFCEFVRIVKKRDSIVAKKEEDDNKATKACCLKFTEKSEDSLDPEWCRKELGEYKDSTICRYCSLESIFSTLKYNTLRLNGLPGMNDRTEGLYVWNLINNLDKVPNDENKRRKRTINNAFILSFSKEEKIDDLTQWRLYGDDAKGVCCVFSIKKENIKDRFFLHAVRYIDKNDFLAQPDELLRKIDEYIKSCPNICKTDFSPAIFFYKPSEFEVEKEVRLLVDNKECISYKTNSYKREWLLTNANNLPNPYIDIKLNEVPLNLKKIILGPNIKNLDTIQVQLETMLEQLKMNVVVEESIIKSYRNRDN